MKSISGKTIGRLSLYRRVLYALAGDGARDIYSRQLAELVGATAAQVRRDMMAVGSTGSSTRGYDVQELVRRIGDFLDAPSGQAVALVGVGNLGRAILAYFAGRRPKLSIEAAFDNDPSKYGRVIHGCRCHPVEDLVRVIKERRIDIGVLTVPADQAQDVADRLVQAGVYGLVNFAPVRLRTPAGVHVEDIDMTMSIEKAAYFARMRAGERRGGSWGP